MLGLLTVSLIQPLATFSNALDDHKVTSRWSVILPPAGSWQLSRIGDNYDYIVPLLATNPVAGVSRSGGKLREIGRN